MYGDYIQYNIKTKFVWNSLWGGKIKDDELIGKNQLGKIWMSIRDNIIF